MAPPFTHRVADLELEPAPLDPDTIIEGSPEVSELILATSLDGRVVRGVWQITPGVLKAGDHAVWRIHETLRKVFQITEPV